MGNKKVITILKGDKVICNVYLEANGTWQTETFEDDLEAEVYEHS